jgi:hypothetical protein
MPKQGWKREPARHALAARGIKSTIKRPNYLKTVSFSHKDNTKYVEDKTGFLVGYMLMIPVKHLRDKFEYLTPGMFYVNIVRSPGGGSEIIVAPFIDEGTGFYSNSRSEPGIALHVDEDITQVTRGDVESAIELKVGPEVLQEVKKTGLNVSSKYFLMPGDTGIIVEPEWETRPVETKDGYRVPEMFFTGSKFRRVSGLTWSPAVGRWKGKPISKWVKSKWAPEEITSEEVLSTFFEGR